jgi:hypothetical protein
MGGTTILRHHKGASENGFIELSNGVEIWYGPNREIKTEAEALAQVKLICAAGEMFQALEEYFKQRKGGTTPKETVDRMLAAYESAKP